MQAIELRARVQKGMLKIPFPGKEKNVKVIIMWENEKERNYDIAQIKPLVSELVKIKAFHNISDPVRWQKEIRNEWE
jgi:hypothetical protein